MPKLYCFSINGINKIQKNGHKKQIERLPEHLQRIKDNGNEVIILCAEDSQMNSPMLKSFNHVVDKGNIQTTILNYLDHSEKKYDEIIYLSGQDTEEPKISHIEINAHKVPMITVGYKTKAYTSDLHVKKIRASEILHLVHSLADISKFPAPFSAHGPDTQNYVLEISYDHVDSIKSNRHMNNLVMQCKNELYEEEDSLSEEAKTTLKEKLIKGEKFTLILDEFLIRYNENSYKLNRIREFDDEKKPNEKSETIPLFLMKVLQEVFEKKYQSLLKAETHGENKEIDLSSFITLSKTLHQYIKDKKHYLKPWPINSQLFIDAFENAIRANNSLIITALLEAGFNSELAHNYVYRKIEAFFQEKDLAKRETLFKVVQAFSSHNPIHYEDHHDFVYVQKEFLENLFRLAIHRLIKKKEFSESQEDLDKFVEANIKQYMIYLLATEHGPFIGQNLIHYPQAKEIIVEEMISIIMKNNGQNKRPTYNEALIDYCDLARQVQKINERQPKGQPKSAATAVMQPKYSSFITGGNLFSSSLAQKNSNDKRLAQPPTEVKSNTLKRSKGGS